MPLTNKLNKKPERVGLIAAQPPGGEGKGEAGDQGTHAHESSLNHSQALMPGSRRVDTGRVSR